MFPCFPVKITKSWNLFFVPYDKGFASSLEFISFGGSYSTKIFADKVFYRSTYIYLYIFFYIFFLFVIINCSPFIFFLHKKSPPTQRYFHKLPLSGLRNTNKTNNILCNFLLRVMKLILFYSFLCCRAIKYKQRIFTQRDGTLFQNTEVDFYFYPTADILHFVFDVY